ITSCSPCRAWSRRNAARMNNNVRLTSGVLVTGCTLAKMVLDAGLRQEPFDVVVLDEASMASMLYALAASFLASKHLVYACDPKQLPPSNCKPRTSYGRKECRPGHPPARFRDCLARIGLPSACGCLRLRHGAKPPSGGSWAI